MKIKYIFPLLLVLFAFACKNELTIFEQINEETKLEEAEIKGSVNSIVKFKDKLYATDGNIYSNNGKSNSRKRWQNFRKKRRSSSLFTFNLAWDWSSN